MAKLNRLKDVLAKQGVSQYRLHKDSGISYSLINGYCSNAKQPSMETLFKLAKTLKINPRELINS
jgi:putative transcriptional regulator